MEVTPTCLICSHTLLRHVSSGNVYWVCSHCRQKLANCLVTLSQATQPEPAISHQIQPFSREPQTVGVL